MFKFERLKVYDKANELLDFIEGRLHRIGKEDRYSLGEQLKRASLAIPTNIAEATSRESPKEEKYFYNVAKGSVYEVVSLVKVMQRRGYIEQEEYQKIYKLAEEIAKMLSGLLNK
ncbi:four helix bundle protein [Patescibacteria group bacterium]|nr:four helix bundle protein [Patescibacteria group bacterium]